MRYCHGAVAVSVMPLTEFILSLVKVSISDLPMSIAFVDTASMPSYRDETSVVIDLCLFKVIVCQVLSPVNMTKRLSSEI